MAKQLRDTQKLLRINTLPFEDIIHIATVTIKLSGKPAHRTTLPLHLHFNQPSDMDHGAVNQIKSVNHFSIRHRGLGLPKEQNR